MGTGLVLQHRPRPLVFAHRGGMAHRPENTVEAFAYARACGITAVETDAWITADGVPVLHHDGVIAVGGRAHRIGELRRADLPAAIPSLADLYAVCGAEMDIAIDILDPAAAPAVVATAARAGALAPAHLWLCDKHIDRLAGWRGLHPDLHLVHSDAHWRRHRRSVETSLSLMRARGVEVLNLRHRHCSASLAAACHEHGVLLFAWGVRRVATMRRLRRIGVDAVMSDHIDRLLAAFPAVPLPRTA